jgi:GNAT superfamily N-acetyltransferase
MSSFEIRAATHQDVAEITLVMRDSLRELGRDVYTDAQIASLVEYVGRPDTQLIDDGTYFVATGGDVIAGCGGWSRRRKVYSGSAAAEGEEGLLDPATEPARIRSMFVRGGYARRGIGRAILHVCESRALAEGFRRLRLVALPSGEAMYHATGYTVVEGAPIVLEDGVVVDCTLMEKSI